jgi:hypothetical protein
MSFEIERGDLKPDVTDSRLYRNLGATRSSSLRLYMWRYEESHSSPEPALRQKME